MDDEQFWCDYRRGLLLQAAAIAKRYRFTLTDAERAALHVERGQRNSAPKEYAAPSR